MLRLVGVNARPLVVTDGVEPEDAGAEDVVVTGTAVVIVGFAVVLDEFFASVVLVVLVVLVVIVVAT